MDRNWVELLQELRVVQTGVQLLTGFLLTLPFQSRFESLDRYQLTVYVVVLLLAVTAVVLFIAPVGYHRALFRQRSKDRLVAAGTAFAKAGLATVGVVVSGGVLLVADVIGGRVADHWPHSSTFPGPTSNRLSPPNTNWTPVPAD